MVSFLLSIFLLRLNNLDRTNVHVRILDNLTGATSFVTVDKEKKYYGAGFKLGYEENGVSSFVLSIVLNANSAHLGSLYQQPCDHGYPLAKGRGR
jgi:hypothetical protein